MITIVPVETTNISRSVSNIQRNAYQARMAELEQVSATAASESGILLPLSSTPEATLTP